MQLKKFGNAVALLSSFAIAETTTSLNFDLQNNLSSSKSYAEANDKLDTNGLAAVIIQEAGAESDNKLSISSSRARFSFNAVKDNFGIYCVLGDDISKFDFDMAKAYVHLNDMATLNFGVIKPSLSSEYFNRSSANFKNLALYSYLGGRYGEGKNPGDLDGTRLGLQVHGFDMAIDNNTSLDYELSMWESVSGDVTLTTSGATIDTSKDSNSAKYNLAFNAKLGVNANYNNVDTTLYASYANIPENNLVDVLSKDDQFTQQEAKWLYEKSDYYNIGLNASFNSIFLESEYILKSINKSDKSAYLETVNSKLTADEVADLKKLFSDKESSGWRVLAGFNILGNAKKSAAFEKPLNGCGCTGHKALDIIAHYSQAETNYNSKLILLDTTLDVGAGNPEGIGYSPVNHYLAEKTTYGIGANYYLDKMVMRIDYTIEQTRNKTALVDTFLSAKDGHHMNFRLDIKV